MPKTAVIIPTFNEAEAIEKVISAIPAEYAGRIVVVDNNSTDATAAKARQVGATVLRETRQGYGYACLKGMAYLNAGTDKPDIVVFLDGDYADYPEEMGVLVKPIAEGRCDLVIGSRTSGKHGRGALTPWQKVGNSLIVLLIRLLYRTGFTDLGPFRAIKFERLLALGMKEQTYGWTVEMQVRAVKQGLRVCEVPVNYRRRIGKSKISGSLKGSLRAGWSMAAVVLKLR